MSSEYEHLHRSSQEGQIKILIINALSDLRPFIKAAYLAVVKKSKIEKQDDADLIVGRIYALANKMTEGKTANFPEKIIVSMELIKKISPLIKNIRKIIIQKKLLNG
ncbi:hypothetical protein ES703_89178 [subsurface metagenome]